MFLTVYYRYEGNDDGDEPDELGSGPDSKVRKMPLLFIFIH